LTERARLEFLKKTFGRYMTEEVMNMLIENPELVQLGGEKKEVTILMSDLRGFTPISERLSPEKIVQMLNNYFEVMVDVINNHHGTINEIKGDGMIVIFGAPQQMTDRAQRAVACSIEMQNAMDGANKQNRDQGLPELEMGIGLNDCEVIVGNVGSKKRRKYGMMGSGVNLTDRIESYTVGGQILISESVLKQAGKILRIDQQMEIHPKGVDEPLIVYDVGGIGGQYNVSLQYRHADFVRLTREIPIHYTVLEGKYAEKTHFEGAIIRLSRTSVEIRMQSSADLFANVKLSITDADGILSRQTFYGKVIKKSDTGQNIATVRFTGVPPEIDSYFQAAIAQAMAPS